VQHSLGRAAVLVCLFSIAPGAALAERFRIPGTGITVDAPPDFVLSQRFPGVQNEATQSSILINEIPAPIASMTAGFTPENLATRGMTLNGTEKTTLSGQAATLYHLTQSAGGTVFEKWLATTGDDTSAVLIVGTFPQSEARKMSAPIRAAVLSTRLVPKTVADRFEGLRYRITPAEGLEIQHRVQNMLLLAAPDTEKLTGPTQPIAVVGMTHSPIVIDDVAAFARERITRTAQITGLKDIEGIEKQVAGRPAYEITARASDKDTGTPLAVYQMVVLDGVDYFITQGLVGETGAGVYMPRFRAIAESMTIQ
jgi:hypothetical protein